MKITAFVVLSSPFRKKTNTQRRNLFRKKRKVWILNILESFIPEKHALHLFLFITPIIED